MSKIQAPPLYNPVVDQTGKVTIPWALFFNQVFSGDGGTPWIPTFVNLTVAGGAPGIKGVYYQFSAALAYFRITITPGTSTSATAGTTYIDNFPLKMAGDGACLAVSGLLGTNAGMCEQASNRIYVPSWSAVTVPLSIVGIVEGS